MVREIRTSLIPEVPEIFLKIQRMQPLQIKLAENMTAYKYNYSDESLGLQQDSEVGVEGAHLDLHLQLYFLEFSFKISSPGHLQSVGGARRTVAGQITVRLPDQKLNIARALHTYTFSTRKRRWLVAASRDCVLKTATLHGHMTV